MLINSLGYNKL